MFSIYTYIHTYNILDKNFQAAAHRLKSHSLRQATTVEVYVSQNVRYYVDDGSKDGGSVSKSGSDKKRTLGSSSCSITNSVVCMYVCNYVCVCV